MGSLNRVRFTFVVAYSLPRKGRRVWALLSSGVSQAGSGASIMKEVALFGGVGFTDVQSRFVSPHESGGCEL